MTLNTAVFAPIPSATVRIAVTVNPGLCHSDLNPNRRSRNNLSIQTHRPFM
jgi:hypothetical protein